MATEESQQFVTGIRVIDVFAPIVLGSVCRLQWRAGTGATILTAELIRRFVQSGGRQVVCAGYLANSEGLREWQAEMAEYELDRYIQDRWLGVDDEGWNERLDDALLHARARLTAGEDVLFVLMQNDSRDHWGERALSRFSGPDASRQFVVLVVTNYGLDQAEADQGDCTSRIMLDPARARAGLYPPVDPVVSTSTANIGGKLEDRRVAVVQKARAAFVAYAEYDPGLQHLPDHLKAQGGSTPTHHLKRLFESCAQPLFVAAPFTGINGIWQSMEDSIDLFEHAMRGG